MLALCFWGDKHAALPPALVYAHCIATNASGDAMRLRTELARFKCNAERNWTLTVVPWPQYSDLTGEAWWNVNLQAKGKPGRFWLGWNGERFARNGHFERAINSTPDALDKAKAVLADALPMQKLQPAPTCTN